ncbi:MAG: tRNA-dihydrouridine synthase [bacterium]
MSNFWKEKIKIGNQSFPRFMAAPMDGITDSPFRQIVREFSREELLFTEMRHVDTVVNAKDELSLKYNKIEQPLAFQFSANKTNLIPQAVKKVLDKNFIQINLNSGCPAKNIVKSGSGSALMANPELLKEIIIAMQKEINGKVPFTLKIRSGFLVKNAPEIAEMAQDLGVDAIIIHPRTRNEKFFGNLDFELVQKIKNKLTIPVIFSGSITDFAAAKNIYEKTGCDGFMIGRALWGAPWKLEELKLESENKTLKIDMKTKLKLSLKHLKLNPDFYGPNGFQKLKSHLAHYITKIKSAAQIRRELLETTNEQEMKTNLEELLKNYK